MGEFTVQELVIKAAHLLRWDLVGHGSHVDLLEDVDTGDDEEDPGTSGSSCEQATKTEDHCSLVFLVCSFYYLYIYSFLKYCYNILTWTTLTTT